MCADAMFTEGPKLHKFMAVVVLVVPSILEQIITGSFEYLPQPSPVVVTYPLALRYYVSCLQQLLHFTYFE